MLCAALFATNSVFAIEAFKSIDLEADIKKGLTYMLLILLGMVLPALGAVIFLVFRHVTQKLWLSFGIYGSICWFALGYFAFNSLFDKTNPNSDGVPITLIVVALLVIVQAIFDIEFVRNKKSKSAQN